MIFRRASYPNENYTTIPNLLIRGSNPASKRRSDLLSPESLGVLVYLLSHRHDWKVTNKQLALVFSVTTNKVTKICKELEASGYLKREIKRNDLGQLDGWDWEVYDETSAPDSRFPEVDKPDLDNQDLSIKIDKEILEERKPLLQKPDGINKLAWDDWWEYKRSGNSGRQPAKSTITRQTKDFELMVKAGFDIPSVVSFAISREWQRIGDPTWDALKQFKSLARRDDLLGAVK